jgi:hypothetical protein
MIRAGVDPRTPVVVRVGLHPGADPGRLAPVAEAASPLPGMAERLAALDGSRTTVEEFSLTEWDRFEWELTPHRLLCQTFGQHRTRAGDWRFIQLLYLELDGKGQNA